MGGDTRALGINITHETELFFDKVDTRVTTLRLALNTRAVRRANAIPAYVSISIPSPVCTFPVV